MEIKDIYREKPIGEKVKVEGWVRFNRPSKNIGFIELTDGSKINGIQLVYKADNEEVFEKLSNASLYSSIVVEGELVQGKNEIEVVVSDVLDIRKTEEDFPIGKKEHGNEFLRDVAHLRIKTKLFQSIMKVRSTASIAIHEFFNQEGFTYVNTPIITGNDAEGAGESFMVGTSEGTFFDKQASLTVSGQLHAEGYAQALKKVYTFGPTFRAENSNTVKHAAEFWMLEPEMAFCDMDQMIDIAWSMLQYVVKKVLNTNKEELELLQTHQNENLIDMLNNIIENDLTKISYTDAIEILNKAQNSGVEFNEKDIKFGIDLGTEHEKFIAGEHFGKPVFVYNYPSEIKSFYMYQNDDGTARGFDLLIPYVGELIGGSQREYRYDVLLETINKKGTDLSDLEWYINLRKNGYADSAGFGLGFERLVMLLTGTENIRDSIPFPRTPGKLQF